MSTKIDAKELKSVKDDSPVNTEDLIKISKKIIKLHPSGINLSNLAPATIEVLSEIKELYHLNGEQKKDLVIDVLHYVIDNTDAGVLENLDPVIKQVIPGVIDSLVKVENGQLVLEKPKNCWKKLTQKIKRCL